MDHAMGDPKPVHITVDSQGLAGAESAMVDLAAVDQ